MTSLVSLIDQKYLHIFRLCHENWDWHVCMFFIHFTWYDRTGRWFLCKQKYLTFSRGLWKLLQYLKFYPLFIVDRSIVINHAEICGLIVYILTYRILTIDTRDVSELGPAKFRTQADSNSQKICYHNRNKRDKTFNSFFAIRKQTSVSEKNNIFYWKNNWQHN